MLKKGNTFVNQDTASGGYLAAFDKPYFGPMGRSVFTLDEAKSLVVMWDKSPTYNFTGMTIHPIFVGGEVK